MPARSINAREAVTKADDFFASRKGLAVILVLLMIGTYLFNTVFGNLLGMLLTILVLVGIGWAQKLRARRRGESV